VIWQTRWYSKMLLALSERRLIRGFDVRVFALAPRDCDLAFSKVDVSLSIIEKLDPLVFEDLKKRFEFIFVRRSGVSGYYQALRTCLLNAQYVMEAPHIFIALTLIHEYTHARLSDRGFAFHYDNDAEYARFEKICIRAELRFVRRVITDDDVAAPLISFLKAHLAEAEEPDYIRKKKLCMSEAVRGAMLEAGLPAWYVRMRKGDPPGPRQG